MINLSQASALRDTLDQQRAITLADLQKAKAAPKATAQTKQQQISDQNQIEKLDRWLMYWKGQKHDVEWNISQDNQIAADRAREQKIQLQAQADEQKTADGHEYYKALKRAGVVPANAPFAPDGWNSIPLNR